MSRVLIRDLVRFYKGLPHQDAGLVELDETLAKGIPNPMDRSQPWFATWSSAGKQTVPNPVPSIVPIEGLALIKEFEGCELEAYDDGVGVWTIGWGNTKHFDGAPVKKGDRITQSVADAMLSNTLENFVLPALKRTIPDWDKMNDGQKGALMSFAYNVGWSFYGQQGFETITKRLADRAWDKVPAAMSLYVNPGTSTEAGLKRRRAAEGALWSKGQAKPPAPVQAASTVFSPASPFSFKVTPNISYGEFALYQEERRFVANHQCATVKLIAEFLEKVRAHFGAPIEITSGYRPPAINAAVGGASQSEHLYDAPYTGAVDFVVTGKDIYAVQDWCDKNWPYSIGYGAPKGFVHLGMRPGRPRVRWIY